MNCDAMLKGTQVDGVYTADPKLDEHATRFDTLDYMEVLSKELKVMDATAISLLKENKIPIVVFRIRDKGGLANVLIGKGVSTVIGGTKK
jgi:uridylate kinase